MFVSCFTNPSYEQSSKERELKKNNKDGNFYGNVQTGAFLRQNCVLECLIKSHPTLETIVLCHLRLTGGESLDST